MGMLNHTVLAKLATTIALSTFLTDVALANVVGSDTQNFNPTTSGLDFVTVHSSETLQPGVLNFGLFINQGINTLPYFEEEGPQSRGRFKDSVIGGDLHMGIGLMRGWDLGISLPQVLHSHAEAKGFRGRFSEKGNTEIRVNSKVRLLGDRQGGFALIGSANFNRLENNPYLGKDAGPTYNLEMAADTTFNKFAVALNLGYRWRSPGEQVPETEPIVPLGDQLIYSAAASYLFSSIDTKVILELLGSQAATEGDENSDRLAETGEALLGLKHDLTTNWALHGGGGTELFHGRASPDWRIYAGINYAVGPTFSKKKNARRKPARQKQDKDPFAGPLKAKEKIVIHDVLFEFDSDSLVLAGANSNLDKLARYLKRKPVFSRLVIEGHTDSVGSDAYNMDLSKRRAETIKKWLMNRYKLSANKIIAIGRGERYPIADNGNYQGRQLNRRVEFTIYRQGVKDVTPVK